MPIETYLGFAMLATLAIPNAYQTARRLPLSTRKVGGLRFVKVGRLTLSFSVSKRYRPL